MLEWLKCIGWSALIFIALGLVVIALITPFVCAPIPASIGAFLAFIFITIVIRESRK